MNLKFIILLVLIVFVSCDSNNKNSINLESNLDTSLLQVDTSNNLSTIKIIDDSFYPLDTFKTNWRLSQDNIKLFFETAQQITQEEAIHYINKNYHPFCIGGKLIKGKDSTYFFIYPSGIGIRIIYKIYEVNDYFFYKYTDSTKALFNIKKQNYPNWTFKILTKKKKIDTNSIYRKDPNIIDLFEWAKKWTLTVSQINSYLNLCDKKPLGYLYERFLNPPCFFYGEMVYKNRYYFYKLEPWGYGKLINIESPDTLSYDFGCFDKRGEKYIESIVTNDVE